ncbi:MAG: hypothetical protein RIT81_43445 [Deltaproteobacteria bacterium]
MRRCALVLVAFAMGCNAAYSNEDILFLKALPRGLSIELPEQDTTASGLRPAEGFDGDHAKFQRDATNGAKEINAVIAEVFTYVDFVVENVDPVVEDEDTRIWGPFPIEDGNEIALLINHVRTSTEAGPFVNEGAVVRTDDQFTYWFAVRPQGGTDDDWIPIIAGQTVPIEGTRHGAGLLILNLAAVDPGEPVIAIGYDSRLGDGFRESIDVAVDVDLQEGAKFDPEGAWLWRRDEVGTTDFALILLQDLPNTGPRLEKFIIATRWFAAGFGRADVVLEDGDLGELVFFASECWNPGFERTYFASNAPQIQDQITGTPDDCAEGLRQPFGGE